MSLTYELTIDELRRLHLRKTIRVVRNRLANRLLPWRWFAKTNPHVEWVDWGTLLALCSRPQGFTVARSDRGQDINYRLIR